MSCLPKPDDARLIPTSLLLTLKHQISQWNQWGFYSVTDALIDMAIWHLSEKLYAHIPICQYGNVILSTLAFLQVINAADSKSFYKKQAPYILEVYKDKILLKGAPKILTGPVFLQCAKSTSAIGHWIAFKVDFVKSEISYSQFLIYINITKLRRSQVTHSLQIRGP